MSKRVIYHSYFCPSESIYQSILFQDSQAWRLKANGSINIFNKSRQMMEKNCRLTPLSLIPGAMSNIIESLGRMFNSK